jgi:hypothetical protein
VLVHHADPVLDGVSWATDPDWLIVQEDLAVVGLQQTIEDVHQGRLASPVLTEQRVDLARLDREVDVVVGDEVAETLGDAAQFESQRNLPKPVRGGQSYGWLGAPRPG